MIESLADRLARARRPAPRRARQDPGAPARHARGRGPGRGSRSPPASSSGIGETRGRAARRARSRSATSHARHGHVQEVIVQNFLPKPGTAMHARAGRATADEFLWTIAAARLVLGAAMHLQAPPNLTDADDLGDARRAPASTTGAASRRVTARPREPRAAVARARRCCATRPRPPGKTLAPRLTVYPEYVRDRERVAARRRALRGAVARPTSRASPATTTGPRGGDAAPRAAPRPLPTPAGRARAGTPGRRGARRRARRAKRSASTRSSRCSARAVPKSRAVAEVADQLRREIVGDDGHLRPQPQHQLHERLHVQVPVLRVLEGPAVAQPARRPVPARPRGDPAPRGRGGRVRRHRGVPAGRDPPRLRRRLLPRRRPGGEGGRARHPRARLHRARGHRGRAAARHAAARLPARSPRRPGSRRCPAPRPRSSTTRCGRSSAPTRSTPRSGSTRTAPRTRSGCARTSRSCSATSSGPMHVARHLVRTRDAAEGDRRVHRVRAAAVRAHGHADLPAAEGARGARRSARCC